MIGMTVTGAERVAANLKGASAGAPGAQERGVRRGVSLIERALKREMSKAGEMDAFWGKQGAAGNGLAARTGRTLASITGSVFKVAERVVGAVGSKAPHLKLHEDGATVQGTSPGGYHRIATAAAKTGAGVDRNTGRSIRDIPGSFLFRSAKGSLWAAVRTFGSGAKQISGKVRRAAFFGAQAALVGATKGGLVLLYLLVKSVTLRPRSIFARVRREQERPVVEAVRAEVSLVVQKANT